MLLAPTPFCREIALGVLARAARLYPVEVHAFAFLSNHYHLLLSVESAHRLAEFMAYLNSNLAREVGHLVRWRERFWGRRYQAIVVSEEEPAQVARLRYVLAHGCKEGFVARPLEWPGANSARALLSGQVISGRWFDRTLEYRARKKRLPVDPQAFASEETLQLAPLPSWRHLSPESYQQEISLLLEEIERATARELVASGREPLGRDSVQRQNPHFEPDRLKKGPAPLLHAASKAARESFRDSYRQFVAAFRAAANRFRLGELTIEFPAGSFPPAPRFVPATDTG